MKRYKLILFFPVFIIFIFSSCTKKNGEYGSTYDNGQVMIKAEFKNDNLDGSFSKFDEQGNLLYKSSFINGKPDGRLIIMSENNKPEALIGYKEGLLDGPYNIRYKTGRYAIKGDYVDGKPHGWFHRWYSNGRKWGQKKFDNGVPVDTLMAWYPSGGLMIGIPFKNGKANGRAIYRNESGSYSLYGEYKDGIAYKDGTPFTGQIEPQYKIGNKALEGEFVGGIKVGKWVGYFQNEQKSFEGEYNNGEVVGTWKYYDKNGSLVTALDYESENIEAVRATEIIKIMKEEAKNTKKLKNIK